MPAIAGEWISVPQAVFLLDTGNLAEARSLAIGDPELLVSRVVRALAARTGLTTEAANNRCAALQMGLIRVLALSWVKAKGSRTPNGQLEAVDPAEFTRLSLAGVHAVNPKTNKPVWHDLRVSAKDVLQLLQRRQADAPPAVAAPIEPSSRQRSAYRSALEEWMATKLLRTLRKMSPIAVANQFKTERPDVPLPKRLRSMEPLIERIIAERVKKMPKLQAPK